MKNIIFLLPTLFVFSLAFSAQAADAKKSTTKKTVTTTTTEAVTEEPAPQPSPTPESTSEPTVAEKVEEKAERASDKIQDTAEKVAEGAGSSLGRRAASNLVITGQYAPIDLVLPSKIGASIGWITSSRNTLELEYLKGSIKPPLIEDLGEVSDTRITLMRRSYFSSNSFNFSYGVAYMGFTGKVGNALLSRLSGGTVPDVDLIDVQSFGTHLGFGNRWVFAHGITFGVDWLQWTQPIFVTKKEAKFLDYVTNSSDRQTIDDALKVLSYLPRLSIVKLQLGYTF